MKRPDGLYSEYYTTIGSIKNSNFYNWLNISNKMKKNLTTIFKISSLYVKIKQKRNQNKIRNFIFYPLFLLEEIRLKKLFNFGWKIDLFIYNSLKNTYTFFLKLLLKQKKQHVNDY